MTVYIAIVGCLFDKYINDHEPSQPATSSSTAPMYSPVVPLQTIAGTRNDPIIATTQAESHSTVPYSVSSQPAAVDIVSSPLSTSTAMLHTKKSITPTLSCSVPITVPSAVVSVSTQSYTKEISLATNDNHLPPVASTNIAKNTVSE